MTADIGRNDPCPCGSGKKYKKCCLRAAAAARSTPSVFHPAADDETYERAVESLGRLEATLKLMIDLTVSTATRNEEQLELFERLFADLEVFPTPNLVGGWLAFAYALFGDGVSDALRYRSEEMCSRIRVSLSETERRILDTILEAPFGMWRARTLSATDIDATPLRPDIAPTPRALDQVISPALPPHGGSVLVAGWLVSYEGVRVLISGTPLSRPNERLFEAALARHAWGTGADFRRDDYEADLLALCFAACVDTGGTGVPGDPTAQTGSGGSVFLDARVETDRLDPDALWAVHAARFFWEGLEFDDELPPCPFYDRWCDEHDDDFTLSALLDAFEVDVANWHIAVAYAPELDRVELIRTVLRVCRNGAIGSDFGLNVLFGPRSFEHRLSADAMLARIGLRPDGRLAAGEAAVDHHLVEVLDLYPEWMARHDISPGQRIDTLLARARKPDADELMSIAVERAAQHHRARLRWLGLMNAWYAGDLDVPMPLFPQDVFIGCRIFMPAALLGRHLATMREFGRGTFTRIEKALRRAEFVPDDAPVTLEDVLRHAHQIPGLEGVGSATFASLLDVLFYGLRDWARDLDEASAGRLKSSGKNSADGRRTALEGLDELEALMGSDDTDA